MKKIYETQEWKGNGKQNYYHNEYRTDGDKVYKVKWALTPVNEN